MNSFKTIINFAIIITAFLFLTDCKTSKENSFTPNYKPGPPAIVYKTKKDYSKNVPVILSEDKTKVTGYFSPSDLIKNGKIAYPDSLTDGFLRDNIGINERVAYTSLTIDKYTKSMMVYDADKLFSLIIDNDPLIEMYNCGNKSLMSNPVDECSKIIKDKQLKKCKKIY